ncbi:phosphopantetheine-binding protein [Azospirillum sp. TSO35-2]|uniref:phosphopantetheine-binding protein n=1 Tax=Azospirillum sp. TSO35-2 TaxID=716796 RepID=UPI000D61DA5E|nr:phosphopantetheine-binding protein [Azospirillum sp. TSO35-2]PWC35976.1 acyl carrier protein [Azospirillum sp. TSO35-2]
MVDLELEIKRLIVDSLKLEDIRPEDIDSLEPLFVEGLGLDSIDALELGIALRKRFGIKIDSATDNVKKHFFNVQSLAVFVHSQKAE